MTQQPPEDKYSSSRDVAAANRLVDHWPVYVALLPAILASAAITVAALSAAGIQHRQFGARQFQIALVITGEIASLSDLVLCCGPLSEGASEIAESLAEEYPHSWSEGATNMSAVGAESIP